MSGFEVLLAGLLPAAEVGADAAASAAMGVTAAGTTAGEAVAATSGGLSLSQIGSGIMGAGTILSGFSAKAMSDAQAASLEEKAREERAAGARRAWQKQRQAVLLESSATAKAAASGGGATDPTVLDVLGDIGQEANYQGGVEKYLGETRARGYEANAAMTRAGGTNALIGSLFKAAGSTATILGGSSPYYDKYGRRRLDSYNFSSLED